MRQVCVIGLGQFGAHLARTLVSMGCEVLALDKREERVDAVRDDVHRALLGDARRYETLESALPATIDEAVVSLGEESIEPSVLCTLNLRRLGVKKVRCTAISDEHAEILREVGATHVIFPERETAQRAARTVATPNLVDMFPLSGDFRIVELEAPKALIGKTLAELELRRNHDVLVVAVKKRSDEDYEYLPGADARVEADQILMVIGRELDIVQLAGS